METQWAHFKQAMLHDWGQANTLHIVVGSREIIIPVSRVRPVGPGQWHALDCEHDHMVDLLQNQACELATGLCAE